MATKPNEPSVASDRRAVVQAQLDALQRMLADNDEDAITVASGVVATVEKAKAARAKAKLAAELAARQAIVAVNLNAALAVFNDLVGDSVRATLEGASARAQLARIVELLGGGVVCRIDIPAKTVIETGTGVLVHIMSNVPTARAPRATPSGGGGSGKVKAAYGLTPAQIFEQHATVAERAELASAELLVGKAKGNTTYIVKDRVVRRLVADGTLVPI